MSNKNKKSSTALANSFFIIVLILIGIAACAAIFYYVFGSIQKSFNLSGSNQKSKVGYTAKNCLGDECLSVRGLSFPAAKISQNVRFALIRALDENYKEYTLYKRVVEKFGPIRPFIMIVRAKEKQTVMLKAVFDKYILDIPENTYLLRDMKIPNNKSTVCRFGSDTELASIDLFQNELMPLVGDYEDITSVFSDIVKMSSEKYLPAFDRCN